MHCKTNTVVIALLLYRCRCVLPTVGADPWFLWCWCSARCCCCCMIVTGNNNATTTTTNTYNNNNRFNDFYSRYTSLVNRTTPNVTTSTSTATTTVATTTTVVTSPTATTSNSTSSSSSYQQSAFVPLSRRRQLEQEENERKNVHLSTTTTPASPTATTTTTTPISPTSPTGSTTTNSIYRRFVLSSPFLLRERIVRVCLFVISTTSHGRVKIKMFALLWEILILETSEVVKITPPSVGWKVEWGVRPYAHWTRRDTRSNTRSNTRRKLLAVTTVLCTLQATKPGTMQCHAHDWDVLHFCMSLGADDNLSKHCQFEEKWFLEDPEGSCRIWGGKIREGNSCCFFSVFCISVFL